MWVRNILKLYSKCFALIYVCIYMCINMLIVKLLERTLFIWNLDQFKNVDNSEQSWWFTTSFCSDRTDGGSDLYNLEINRGTLVPLSKYKINIIFKTSQIVQKFSTGRDKHNVKSLYSVWIKQFWFLFERAFSRTMYTLDFQLNL